MQHLFRYSNAHARVHTEFANLARYSRTHRTNHLGLASDATISRYCLPRAYTCIRDGVDKGNVAPSMTDRGGDYKV